MRLFLAFFYLFVFVVSLSAQEKEVVLMGTIRDTLGNSLPGAVLVNKTTGLWKKGNKEGVFSFSMMQKDTMQVYVVGYEILEYVIDDSIKKESYDVIIKMKELSYNLDEFVVKGVKSYNEIRKGINSVQLRIPDKYPDATIANPISLLFEKFSKKEQSNRLAAQLEYQLAMDNLLKDLFDLYNKYEIIDLNDHEYDNFIAFMGMSDEYLKASKDYDLALIVKKQFLLYRKLGY